LQHSCLSPFETNLDVGRWKQLFYALCTLPLPPLGRTPDGNGMEDLFSLKGKTFLVTGGTRGIGRAISIRFARAGAKVISNYVRDEKAAEELKEQYEEEGLTITLCRADLTLKKGLEGIEGILSDTGMELSGLVHCAATGVHRPLKELTSRHLDWTFALNVRAFFELVKIVLPRLAPGSTIVALSSDGAERAVPFYTLVGASKGALEAMGRHLAAELADRGIRVNMLAPGSIRTGAWDAILEGEQRLQDEVSRIPLGRLVTAEEVAWAAQFLCSEASSGLVGHTLVVDGGHRIVS
jgi:NAD(P)-dependent dehydrogenase (short-subunit alcohol dehydrogenase family)